jgi:hypothetical protein
MNDRKPEIENDGRRCREADPDDGAEHPIAAINPEQRRRQPVAFQPNRSMHGIEIFERRKNPVRADEAVNLEVERVERREEDHAEAAEPDPAGAQE